MGPTAEKRAEACQDPKQRPPAREVLSAAIQEAKALGLKPEGSLFAGKLLAALTAAGYPVEAGPALVEALEALLELFQQPNETEMGRFERVAALYYGETGRLAPGKDVPMSSADRTTIEKRYELYDDWMEGRVVQARAALALALVQEPAP